MRNPEGWRKIALAFFISGCVAAPAAFLLSGLSRDSWMRGFLFIYGLMAIIIACWRVEPEAWNDFVALDRRWNEDRDFRPNELSHPLSVPVEGVEVIVGR